jgi:hypothetical protein
MHVNGLLWQQWFDDFARPDTNTPRADRVGVLGA